MHSIVGRFGTGQTNDRGWRLPEFAKSHLLTLANTLHPHKLSRTATWHNPNGQVHNLIDIILTPQCFKSIINKANTRPFPGANTGSYHDLVHITIKLKLKTKHFMKSPHIQFVPEKLKDLKIVEVFQAKVHGKFAVLCILDSNVVTLVTV